MSNLRQIGLAASMYAREHNNELPSNLQVLLEGGLIEESTLRSPLADADAAESYVYLGGDLKSQAGNRIIMAYEKPEHYDGEGTLVLFLDSHVEFIPLDEFEGLLEKTKRVLDREPDQEGEPIDKPLRAPGDGGAEVDPEEQRAMALLSCGVAGRWRPRWRPIVRMVGQYPQFLAELSRPPSAAAERARWKGPYLEEMMDPWSRRLEYRFPGRQNVRGYDLWSLGPDGENGTFDDITNWQYEQ